ncbi:hypothetical protein JIN84_04485 [Luteolibacter yonseiensis]|uniref:Uncharacterized protein n=1 Tax=Luteolibacter yonseiensis TaxID=1144680 RepID=A0A934R165_9BACT|nr:hypothetical protein [Luteolibacter yonseiensis]MBK1814859.1 hypothetical protein [Luteolibacter yonseiensis]
MQADQIPWLEPDSAAVFAAAMSLWTACHAEQKRIPTLNLGACCNGMDQLMREVMRIAEVFEKWACGNVLFERLDDVWPYMMQDRFGAACLHLMGANDLAGFTQADCARVALWLGLPIR